jgi:hypothetical protein
VARNSGTPIFYTLEFTSVASGVANAQTQNLVFNDPGNIKGITFEAIDAAGNRLERAAVFLNVQRQNQFGLTTSQTSAAAFTGTGERPYSMANMLGEYRVTRNDSITVTLTNLTGVAMAYGHVCFLLHADRDGLA